MMNPIPVVVLPEFHEFSLKIPSIPKEEAIKVFATNGSDEALNEGMRYRCIWDGLNLVYTKNPQVRLPLVIQE